MTNAERVAELTDVPIDIMKSAVTIVKMLGKLPPCDQIYSVDHGVALLWGDKSADFVYVYIFDENNKVVFYEECINGEHKEGGQSIGMLILGLSAILEDRLKVISKRD